MILFQSTWNFWPVVLPAGMSPIDLANLESLKATVLDKNKLVNTVVSWTPFVHLSVSLAMEQASIFSLPAKGPRSKPVTVKS